MLCLASHPYLALITVYAYPVTRLSKHKAPDRTISSKSGAFLLPAICGVVADACVLFCTRRSCGRRENRRTALHLIPLHDFPNIRHQIGRSHPNLVPSSAPQSAALSPHPAVERTAGDPPGRNHRVHNTRHIPSVMLHKGAEHPLGCSATADAASPSCPFNSS